MILLLLQNFILFIHQVLLHISYFLSDDFDFFERVIWMFNYAALIPFTEFREKLVMEKYDVKVDAEVLELLDTVAKQKHVCVVFVLIPTLCNL